MSRSGASRRHTEASEKRYLPLMLRSPVFAMLASRELPYKYNNKHKDNSDNTTNSKTNNTNNIYNDDK